MMSTFAIVTATLHGREQWLFQTAASVYSQSGPLTWLLVTDGQEPSVVAQDVARAAPDHVDVRLLTTGRDRQVGPSATRNVVLGWLATHGRDICWVVPLDNDDMLPDGTVDAYRHAAGRCGHDVAMMVGHGLIWEDGSAHAGLYEHPYVSGMARSDDLLDRWVRQCGYLPWLSMSGAFQVGWLQRLGGWAATVSDEDANLQLAASFYPVVTVPQVTYVWHRHDQQTMPTISDSSRQNARVHGLLRVGLDVDAFRAWWDVGAHDGPVASADVPFARPAGLDIPAC